MHSRQEKIKYPITSENFAENIPIEANIINEYMSKYNFIVCSVLSPEECDLTIEQIWKEMNALGNGKLDPMDVTTWINENWPCPDHIYLSDHFTTAEQCFKNMVNKNVTQIFKILHKTPNIYAVADRVSIKRPTIVNGVEREEWKLNPLRLHFDRDTPEQYNKYPPRYQAHISLVDSGYDVGSFAAVPGCANEVKKHSNLWTHVDQGKYILTGKSSGYLYNNLQKIPIKAGDMVIWDKSVAHANFVNVSDKPRITQFFTFVPAVKYAMELNENNIYTYLSKHPEYKKELLKYNWTTQEKQILGLVKYKN